MIVKHLLLIVCLCVINCAVQGGNAHLFDFNEEALHAEFTELDRKEYRILNTGMSNDEDFPSEFIILHSAFGVHHSPPMGIPSFIWGFFLSCLGVMAIYVHTESSKETSKSLLGCMTSGAAFIIFYSFYAVAKS